MSSLAGLASATLAIWNSLGLMYANDSTDAVAAHTPT